ncbi:hypothetical protein HKD37_18G049962 [Glycine soja]
MATFHGCHSPYGASMTAFHGCHSSYRASTFHYHHPHYSSPNETSMAAEDRLKAVLAKLDAATCRLDSQLDALLLKLPPRTSHHLPSSSFAQSPPPPPLSIPTRPPCFAPIQPSPAPLLPLSQTPSSPPPLPLPLTPPPPPPPPLLPPPLKSTPSPTLTAPTIVPPPPAMMPPSPPPPPLPPLVPIQSRPTTLPGPLPMPVLHLSGLVHTTISFNKLFSIVPPCGTSMAVYKLPLMIVALCTTAKPGAIRRKKPWDLGHENVTNSTERPHADGIVREDGAAPDRALVPSRRYVGSGIRK